ncbi:uncharacterized protein LOC111832403 [Capsella rubella]|uniref:uncharacterized protein LOC111832403 n=1 Tax=Capsella rubella TaxID=81985 RepID=UPI000CD57337|nr:uncharacterized protein LOC111832403 [Capsella rubella]
MNVEQTETLAKSDHMHPVQELKMCLPANKDDEVSTNNILLQEESPDQSLNQPTVVISKDIFNKDLCQVSPTLLRVVSNNLNDVIIMLLRSRKFERNVGTNEDHKGDSPEMKKRLNQNRNRSKPAPLVVTPSLMETRRVPSSFFIKEELPDFKTQAHTQEGANHVTPSTVVLDQNRGVIFTFLPKGEPPDAPCIMKTEQHQERGYDADIRTRSDQEHTKPVYMENFGESLSKWSSDQVQGEGLIIHHDINPKNSDSSRGIKNQQVKSPYYWDMTVALFFPYLGFVPMGFPKKVFNEAISSHQGIIHHPYDSKMIADVHSDLLADKHAELLADLTTQEADESLLAIHGAKGDQAAKTPSLFTYARVEAF